MACARGKASPNTVTRLRLFADSAGYCQKPDCLLPLFESVEEKDFHLGELAHIFAANDRGPRANKKLSAAKRGAYENLILLCPLCHTRIDKAPKAYPEAVVISWKQGHKDRLAKEFGVKKFSTRAEARDAIEGLLLENRTIFETYGPNNDEWLNPEGELSLHWRRKALTRIVPNNRRLLHILNANKKHLLRPERNTVEVFRQHVDDLEARHLGEPDFVGGVQFPTEMSHVFEDEP